jgi:UPF0271 protein
MTRKINLNADMGESLGSQKRGDDEALVRLVGSASLACGFHAGDPKVMAEAVALCKAHEVSIGAHPSFPDIEGFGRCRMQLPASEIEALAAYQIGALSGVAKLFGMRVFHVKPHGALSNMAAVDIDIARAIAKATLASDPSLILLSPIASCLSLAGREAGLAVAEEIFADRAYDERNNLVPRSEPGAMIEEPEEALAHTLALLKRFPEARSVCVHGDGPKAVLMAQAIRHGLEKAGVALAPLPEVMS